MACWTDVNWASSAIEALSRGQNAVITPHGGSMAPRVQSGQHVELQPVDRTGIHAGDVVLVKVKGIVYLHLVKALRANKRYTEYQIGNNKGGINGWVARGAIYGIAKL